MVNVLRVLATGCLAAGLFVLAAGGLAQDAGEPEITGSEAAATDPSRVHVAPLVGPIGPATAAFIERAINDAEAADAAAVVIEMDTPGGLDQAMRSINQAILNADAPIIVYVHPPGARAASAGAYILYASHLAAMAPGTSVGAATPVQMGGGGGAPSGPEPTTAPEGTDPAVEAAAGEAEPQAETPSTPVAPGNTQAMRNKAVNDAVAYIRSLAELRGRNADWAEDAVREAASVSADEALRIGVIEIEASNFQDLFAQAEGREITLQNGSVVTLALEDAVIEQVEKTFAEEVLSTITDPNIAFLLLNLGFIGLLVSFYNGLEPITGIAGLICLIVGLYALNTLPVNYAGAALIVLGLALLVAEAFLASSGLLALGGLAAFVIGAVMLVDTEAPAFRIDWRLIAGIAVTLGGALFFVVSYGLAAQTRKVTTGAKGLVGQTGQVINWSGSEGFVHVDGERWHAVSADVLAEGDSIKVLAVDGLTLKVKKRS